MEMKKQEKSSLLNQYNHDLSNVMNEEEPSSSIIQKIKIATEHIVNYTISEKLGLIAAYGENSDYISIWKYDFETENIKGALSPAGIISFPDLEASKDELAYFEWDATQEYLLVAFTNGRLYFLNSSREIKSIIQLEPGLVKGSIVWNPYSTEALSVGYSGSYMIIDPVNEKVFHNKQQNLKGLLWQNQENYAALTEDNSISLYSINQENPIEVFAGDEGTEAMKFSKNSLFLATFSSKMNAIKIWIMNSKNYLYCFTDPEKICDFIWNDNDDLTSFYNFFVIVFEHSIKIFDIEYGTIKNKIDFDEKLNLKQVALFNKDTMALVTQEDGSVSVYSLNSLKRLNYIQNSSEISKLKKVGNVAVVGTSKEELSIIRLKKVL